MLAKLFKNLILPAIFIIAVMFFAARLREEEFIVDTDSSFKLIFFLVLYNSILYIYDYLN